MPGQIKQDKINKRYKEYYLKNKEKKIYGDLIKWYDIRDELEKTMKDKNNVWLI
jgi:ATP-dependent Lon protease